MNFFCSALCILACVCVHTVQAAIGTSEINCAGGSTVNVGSTTEGFEGDVEILTNISPGENLQLEAHHFSIGITFLELVHLPGETTATIKTTKPLDADALSESGGVLYYIVKCKTFKNTRILTVEDINDNAPVFDQKQYTSTVSETEGVGFQVLKVRAVDADATPANSIVTYSLLSPAPPEFEVRNDGTIRLLSRLNYNVASLYNFTVKAADSGGLYDTTTVIINVQDFDNTNPYFDHALYQASVPENQVGTFTTVTPEAIKARDGDTGINQTVVYDIISVTPSKYRPNFGIDRNTGVVSVTTALDREEIETITLQIQAAQEDDSTKTANAVVLVSIEDVNDNAPEFDQSNYTVVIPENSPRDRFVLQAKVTDLDQGGFVGTLRLVPDTVPFFISPDGSIWVKTSTELDRETTRDFTFQIEAREDPPSTHSTTASVNITLSDENDNSPVFGSTKYEGRVPMDQTVGMLVVKVEATDLDEGPNGQIRYFINFGNEEGYFGINENTGEISLNKTIPLLENKILQFFLYVTAKDGGSVSLSSSVVVDIKAPGDSRPHFLQKTYQGKVVEEEEAGVEIVKVVFLSMSPEVPVTLTVETEAEKFSIDQLTGMLTTKVKLDYEAQKNYTVQVSISDGTNRDEASVHVEVLDINDNRPTFASSSIAVNIPEDAEIGANVTYVQATDADSGLNAEIRYSLEGSAGMFSMNPETGLIFVVAALDRETQDKYNLIVVAQDQGRPPLSAQASVVVTLTDVNDNSPVFSTQRYEASVLENATVGMNVIVVNATDKDEGPNGQVTYHIAKQEPPSPPAAFSIDDRSGIIRVAQNLDYGKAKKYTLEVEGRDGGSPSLTGSATVVVLVEDVNDKAPKFSKDQYDVAVYENIAPGSPLVSLEVTDENEGGFSNGHFLLTSDVFTITNEGVVHLLSNSSLDRETRDNYVLEVVAVDQPVNGLSATAQINIIVLDVNDNNPQYSEFQSPITIPEDKTGKVTQIQVSDRDIDLNGEVTLTTYSYGDVFGFTSNGTLMVTGTLDREEQEIYDLVLVARDSGTPSRHNITTLTIIVTDINDNAPVFSQASYSIRVLAEDVKKGGLALTVSATDRDAGNNSLVTYRFSEGSDMVDLNPETGAITWTRDLTNVTEYMDIQLIVLAEDHGTPRLNATATVTIEVRTIQTTDSIVFEKSTYFFSVKENGPIETNVGEIKALTGNQLIQVTYSLMSHTDLFTVDSSTGAIKTLQTLDKEDKEMYIINVEATDSRTATNTNTAKTTVVIQVEDVNETPVFERETYTAETVSTAPFRYPVVTVKALDPDVGDSEELRYSLQESSSLLGIESTSGQVYVLDLSGMGGKRVTAHVKATDKHGLSATAEIQIHVKDSDSENIVVIALNQPLHSVEKKITETQKSLEKVLGWSVHIISIRGENGNEMRSRVTKINAKTYISFIAVDTDGVAIGAQKVHEKLKHESESVKVELEKVFGSNVELEEVERESEEQENAPETTAIVLGVLLALCFVALITLAVVYVIKLKKIKDTDSDRESFNIAKAERCSVFTNEDAFKAKQEDQQSWCSNRKASGASPKGSVEVTASDNCASVTSSL
ncbi:protocadherin Fat 4 [Ictalurus punctatus]|uniref:Protocadherin Fat 4 n=1 Tax=Ictalurus punctatus TaxID=7998 RepID=A0A2D0Q3U3_ICTPU|nr:protocadherin Fat 4 [Ictalurus punctatus]